MLHRTAWWERLKQHKRRQRRDALRHEVGRLLRLESLEDRRLLATVHYDDVNDIVTFTAEAGIADQITVTTPAANQVRIDVLDTLTLQGAAVGHPSFNLATANQLIIDTSGAPIDLLVVRSGDQNDQVQIQLAGAGHGVAGLDVSGQDGNDQLLLRGDFTEDVLATAETFQLTGPLVARDASVTAHDPQIVSSLAAIGNITLQPDDDTDTVGLGTGTGTFQLTETELTNLASAGVVTVGRSTATGAIDLNGSLNLSAETFGLTVRGGPLAFQTGLTIPSSKTLTLQVASITSPQAGTDVTIGGAGTLAITAAGPIGASNAPLTFAAANLATNTAAGSADQFLAATGAVALTAPGVNAGSGTVQFQGGTFRLAAAEQVADTTNLTIDATATFDLRGFQETVNGLSGAGMVDTTAGVSATFHVGGGGASSSFAGTLQNTSGALALTKSGGGTLTLTGGHSYGGVTTVAGGTLRVNGSLADGAASDDVVVQSSASLGGTGSIQGQVRVAGGGELAPGVSPGVETFGSLVFTVGSSFAVEIGGAVAGNGITNHDQAVVSAAGSVTLNGATLNLSSFNGYVPLAGDEYVVVLNQSAGAVNGLFKAGAGIGLPAGTDLTEGTVLSANFLGSGRTARITYAGGNGNDVSVVVDGGTVMVADPDGQADSWTLRRVGTSLQLLNGTTIVAARPVASNPALVVQGEDGQNDTLTLDFGNGSPLTPAGLAFHGGAAGNDDLIVQRGGSSGLFQSVTHSFASESAGQIAFDVDGAGGAAALTVDYTGLEPMSDNLDAPHREFVFHAGAETIVLSDIADAGGNQMRIDSNVGGETLEFANPTQSLTIRAGTGDDTINVASIDSSFRAALTLDGEDNNDTIQLNASLVLGSAVSTGSAVFTAELIQLNAPTIRTDDDTTNNDAGSIQFNGPVVLQSDVNIDTDSPTANDGDVAFSAGIAGTTLGNQSLALTTGSRDITFGGAIGSAGAALESLTVTSAGIVTFSGDVFTDSAGGSGSVQLTAASARLASSLAIDTEQGDDGNAGSVLLNTALSATAPGRDLLVRTATGAAHLSGEVSLGTLNNAAGSPLRNVTVNASNPDGSSPATGFHAGDVTFAAAVTLAAGGNLDVDGRSVALSTAASDITVSGAGTITLDTTRGISLVSGASLTGVDGNIELRANQGPASSTGNFDGIQLVGATVRTSGMGQLQLRGRAGTVGRGVAIESASVVEAQAAGAVVVEGTGDATSSAGILFASASRVGTATSAADVALVANHLIIQAPAIVETSAGGDVVIRPRTPNWPVALGGADTLTALGIASGEINQITTGRLQIGDAATGTITAVAPVAPTGTSQLALHTGAAIDDGNASNPDINVSQLSLTSGTGVGTGGTDGALDISVGAVSATTAGGAGQDIRLIEANGLTDLDLQAGAGDIQLTLTAGGIADTSSDGEDLVAANATITLLSGVAASVGQANNRVETRVNTLAVSTAAGGGNLFLQESNGLTGLNLDAAGGNATLVLLAGSLVDADATDDVVAGDLILESVAGIGTSAAQPLQVRVTRADITNTTSASIFIHDTNGGLVLADLDSSGRAVSGSGGAGEIRASSPLTINSDAITTGGMTYSAGDSAATGDDLLLTSGATVRDTAGALTLQAGDRVTLDPGTTTRAFSLLTIRGDVANADAVAGTIVRLGGSLVSDSAGISVIGGSGDDQFIVDSNAGGANDGGTAAVLQSSAVFSFGGGADTLILDDSGSASDANIQISRTGVGDGVISRTAGFFPAGVSLTFTDPTDSGIDAVQIATRAGGTGDTVTIAPNQGTRFGTSLATIHGNAPAVAPGDVLRVDVTGVPSPLLTLSGVHQGTWTFAGFQPVAYTSFENVSTGGTGPVDLVLDTTSFGVGGDAVPDTLDARLDASGTQLELRVNGTLSFVGPRSDIRSLTVTGSADGDTFTVTETAGGLPGLSGAPAGSHTSAAFVASARTPTTPTIHFDGGGGGAADQLAFQLATSRDVAYFSDAADSPNSGMVNIAGVLTLSFESLTPISFVGAGGTLTVDATGTAATTALTLADVPGTGVSQITGNGGFETTTFSGFDSLVMRGGDGGEVITLASVDGADPDGAAGGPAPLTSLSLSGDNT
ncbi:MAG: autotransporter-associated beta strand repeat-containing protein, partial [Pirellulaceae bacterium]